MSNRSVILFILLFIAIGVALILSGISSIKFGKEFRKEATEAFATVERCFAETHTSTDADGNTSTTTEYYLQLKIDIDGLPSSYKKRVNYSVYRHTSNGDTVQIFYIPGDSKHIALNIDEWIGDGKAEIAFGSFWTAFSIFCLIWVITRQM